MTVKKYYDLYLKKDKDGECLLCGKETKFRHDINIGYRKFCTNSCGTKYNSSKFPRINTVAAKIKMSESRKLYLKTPKGKRDILMLSKNRMGDKNPVHRQSKETRDRMAENNSMKMRLKISKGEFVPNITNSWCRSMVIVNGKKYRSSWEAVFHILNPDLEYEKILIPYFDTRTNKKRSYIVDFVNYIEKIIYEIKPESNKKNDRVKDKECAANIWAKENGYVFIFISDSYFKDNAKFVNYDILPEKIKRSMKQFLK